MAQLNGGMCKWADSISMHTQIPISQTLKSATSHTCFWGRWHSDKKCRFWCFFETWFRLGPEWAPIGCHSVGWSTYGCAVPFLHWKWEGPSCRDTWKARPTACIHPTTWYSGYLGSIWAMPYHTAPGKLIICLYGHTSSHNGAWTRETITMFRSLCRMSAMGSSTPQIGFIHTQ